MFTYVKNYFTKVKYFILKTLNIENNFTASEARKFREKYKEKNLKIETKKLAKLEKKANRVANKILKDLEYMSKHGKTVLRLSKLDFRYNYNYFGDIWPISKILEASGFTTNVCNYENQEDELLIMF